MIFSPHQTEFTLSDLNASYLEDETVCVEALMKDASFSPAAASHVEELAIELVAAVRSNQEQAGGLDAFLQEYDLSSKEGIVLMCLAEALLRIPDAETADALIRDKLREADWQQHLGSTDSLFVNASTWGLMLTGQLVDTDQGDDLAKAMKRLLAKAGEPVVRTALRSAMKIMGFQYVMGRNIGEAIKRSQKAHNRIYRYSFDMLGEAALTHADAERYQDAYMNAIAQLGKKRKAEKDIFAADSISIKLSALYPRYEFSHRPMVLQEMAESLLSLMIHARQHDIAITIDAEEASRLELSLELFAILMRSKELSDWHGLGLAVQAYQKRAPAVLRWLQQLARETNKRIPLRLVKGAYWDTEIKLAQMQGLESYPVFTRKSSTDLSYLACAKYLLHHPSNFYPQFATHNARTVAAVIEMAKGQTEEYEFQRLHGMGEELYAEVVGAEKMNIPCRVYAPVGAHKDLLPYLVRRLLENGANSSFVNRISDANVPIKEIVADPVELTAALNEIPHPGIVLPNDLYRLQSNPHQRQNSSGINFHDSDRLLRLAKDMQAAKITRQVTPLVATSGNDDKDATSTDIQNPADHSLVATLQSASADDVDTAITAAVAAAPGWNRHGVAQRAQCLRQAADLYEQHHAELMSICVREAGKTIEDALAELREAVDFLRYYASVAEANFCQAVDLPGPTGESNSLSLSSRGVFVCISPWNFPLAIFTGQIAAALVTGNSVIAKPAEQTPLVAYRAAQLMHEAGVPKDVLQYLPGEGAVVGARLTSSEQIAGVAFTGSTATARLINQSLAAKEGPIAALVAETGGQNAMIVDSSALPEQVVIDVVQSAFKSAGQRCSACRILCLQEEIADRVCTLLKGHMDELILGDPSLLETDVGPVIDNQARQKLEQHVDAMRIAGAKVFRSERWRVPVNGHFVAPTLIELESLNLLKEEQFGPILHVVRYDAEQLDQLLASIRKLGYGLTLGVHSRINQTAQHIFEQMPVGNTYVNRNMVGAVVGTQPFGGCNLSGTGPKAGGPHYLHRFASEKTLTINTSAIGGNASLLSL